MITNTDSISLIFYINDAGVKVDFQTIELKDAYVSAELKNITCQNAYFDYQKARSLEDRKRTSTLMWSARYNFYKNWASKNHVSKEVPSRPNSPRAA